MKAIILAAGIGKRLEPLTNNIPKGMIRIGGKSIIERAIDVFRSCNIKDITVVTGYCSNTINFPNITYFKNEHFNTTDINETLFCARKKLNDSVIISYSDIIYEKKLIQQILDFKGDFGIAVNSKWKEMYDGRTDHPYSEAENVLIENNKILEIRKNIDESAPNQILAEFLGLIKLSKKGTKILVEKYDKLSQSHQGKFHDAPSFKKAYLTDMIQELIDSGFSVEPIFIQAKWREIDTIQDLKRAEQLFD